MAPKMEPTPPSSRSSSTTSAEPSQIPPSQASGQSSPTSQSMSDTRSTPIRKRATVPTHSRLSRPFRSPIKPDQIRERLSPAPTASGSKAEPSLPSPPESSRGASSSSAAVRKQRQALESRLLLLQQANKCLREDSLTTLPDEIARWREAGQLAARDLWKMTGADGGDWTALEAASAREDHALEDSPPLSSSNPLKRKAHDLAEPPNPLLLPGRKRIGSPGAEEQAAALRSVDDTSYRVGESRSGEGFDSQGAESEVSLPDLSELLRRSRSAVGAGRSTSQSDSQISSRLGTYSAPAAVGSISLPSAGLGIESKWNIGSMLDMLGADKSTLGWSVDEEEFTDSTPVDASQSTHTRP